MPEAPARLRQRADFLRVARGGRCARPGLVLQALARDDGEALPRVGFTVSKRVGNAVERNRVKRRLKALANRLIPLYAQPGHDYVLIGRRAALMRSHAALGDDLKRALDKLSDGRPAPEAAQGPEA
jgi:ribonuclease P protein component